MSEVLRQQVHIDTEIDSYRGFLSDDWAERIYSLAANAGKLKRVIFDLVMDWRAAAYTASLPVCVVDHVKAYHDGFVNGDEPNTNLLRLARHLPAILAERLPETTCDPSLLRRIRDEIVRIGAAMEDAYQEAKQDFPLQHAWQTYLQHHVYQLSLWGSQRICYVSIYNAYESFVCRCVAIALKVSGCRSSNKEKFKKLIIEAFGEPTYNNCWMNEDLKIVRAVRHSLSHAGGALTDELRGVKHGFVVLDGRLQVTPEKTKALFSLLKQAATALAEDAAKIPTFA